MVAKKGEEYYILLYLLSFDLMAIEQSEMERSWVRQGGTFDDHADPRPLKNKATSKRFIVFLEV